LLNFLEMGTGATAKSGVPGTAALVEIADILWLAIYIDVSHTVNLVITFGVGNNDAPAAT
jgi:hypothetical protein